MFQYVAEQGLVDSLLSSSSAGDSGSSEFHWFPVPLCLLDAGLLWTSTVVWKEGSWWARQRGPFRGQLRTVAVCTFTILPILLAAWLIWMPYHCSPLPCILALLVAILSSLSYLFWTSRIPVIPPATVERGSEDAGARIATVSLLHSIFFVFMLSSDPTHECASFAELLANPSAFGELLHAQIVAQTIQSMQSPAVLVSQVR